MNTYLTKNENKQIGVENHEEKELLYWLLIAMIALVYILRDQLNWCYDFLSTKIMIGLSI